MNTTLLVPLHPSLTGIGEEGDGDGEQGNGNGDQAMVMAMVMKLMCDV